MGGLVALGIAVAPPSAGAELRIGDLNVFLNDLDLTVQLVLVEAIPPSFHESLESGIPVKARISLELWQYNRFWMDTRINASSVERQLTYDVLAKEYKVVSAGGERQRGQRDDARHRDDERSCRIYGKRIEEK